LIDLLYKSFSGLRADRLAWKLSGDRLRILCYHGVCEDRLAGEPWVPSYFVTRSAFDSQLQYLHRNASVLPLSDAVRRLREQSLPAGAVSITFDDGYANNLHLALPLLQRYRMPAAVFLSTAYIESGDWYPFVKLKLLRLKDRSLTLPEYKSNPVDTVLQAAASHWPPVEASLTSEQRETLRPLTVSEVRGADSALIEFGAHSHTHGIARNETPERRGQEVRVSVGKVAAWTGRRAGIYSYPNGESGDFGEIEKEALRAEGITAAVTGIGGANRSSCDPLELKRYPFTLHHDKWRFRAEVTGLRSTLLSVAGSRQQ
jgi:peptidoglycan/xylan/chitin deacetylase (PgdA/CDA1 family)